jgi:hypothetical protein
MFTSLTLTILGSQSRKSLFEETSSAAPVTPIKAAPLTTAPGVLPGTSTSTATTNTTAAPDAAAPLAKDVKSAPAKAGTSIQPK